MKQPSLGEVLRKAREAQGLSLGQLARLTGTVRSQILRWETGERVPKTAALLALAEQLELPAVQLLALAGERPVTAVTPSIPVMLRAEYDLPAEAIEDIQSYISSVAEKYRRKRRPSATKAGSAKEDQVSKEGGDTNDNDIN